MKLSSDKNRQIVGLLLLGGHHHILHLVPIARDLEAYAHIDVEIFVSSDEEKQACQNILTALGAHRTIIRVLKPRKFIATHLYPKLYFVLSHLKLWKSLDALIVVERTSTILRFFSKRLPVFIHIPHGAGDRAKSYDPRIRHFDYVLVAGSKDKNRMVNLGLVTNENCFVTGYIKPFTVNLIYPKPQKLFKNNNPVVLYNPHFESPLSSWGYFGEDLIGEFSKCKDMNFIIAPHMRLFTRKKPPSTDVFKAVESCENIIVDLGSERSTNMTYTRAADIYLGDVSSQVYEFLSEPKPCIFIGSADTLWHGNPDYAHWSYGTVCHSVDDVMTALSTAEFDLPTYQRAQEQGCRAAKGEISWDPIKRAANIISEILKGR